MASQWTTEHNAYEYGELQASAMSVDCHGRWAVLAGRKSFTFVEMSGDKVKDKPIKSSRQSKWEVRCVQWNPLPSHASNFVTACNQRLDLFIWMDRGCMHRCSMRGHSRAVSDIDWSPFDVNTIASCSVDTFTHLWDIREPRKPQISFQTVAGVSQVKWNRVKNNLLATTHEGDVRVWDPRKGNTPLHYIAAHLSKIHGLDWSPHQAEVLATSSQDSTVKFWDINNPRQSTSSLSANFPVWRGRYTPFGTGLVMVTLPMPALRRVDDSVYLWNYKNTVSPVHQLIGHKDVIYEFHWRKDLEDDRDYQLVTWAKDQVLRLWTVDPYLQKKLGSDVDVEDSDDSNVKPQFTLSDHPEEPERVEPVIQTPPRKTKQEAQDNSSQPKTLQQEFSLVNTDIQNIHVEELDYQKRRCTVTVLCRNNNVRLRIRFPPDYPFLAIPTFEFLNESLGEKVQKRVLLRLSEVCQKHVKKSNNCLEPLLRTLTKVLDELAVEDRRTPESESAPSMFPRGATSFSQFYRVQDDSIPFPRTSGARFCAAGYIVIFGRAREATKPRIGMDYTPKALGDLTQISYNGRRIRQGPSFGVPGYKYSMSPPTKDLSAPTIKQYYYRETSWHRISSKEKLEDKDAEKNNKGPNLAPIKIYDASSLLPINKQLAECYKLDVNDIPGMCHHNATQAANIGRKDLVQMWSMVERMADKKLAPSSNPNDGSPWAFHPFGRKLLNNLLDFYRKMHDVQTLALLCCIFCNKVEPQRKLVQSQSTEFVPIDSSCLLGSSVENGWNVLRYEITESASERAYRMYEQSYHLLSPMIGPAYSQQGPAPDHNSQTPLSEVASNPNLAALFQTAVLKLKRSNSWSINTDQIDDYCFDDCSLREKEKEQQKHESYMRMLDSSHQQQYDHHLRAYADILYHWKLINQSRHVLKFLAEPADPHTGIEFALYCHKCGQQCRGPQCGSCKLLAFNCVICHIGVKGTSNFCLTCGHGGHTEHILDWFQTHKECPTGCGCKCIKGKTYISASQYS